MNKREIVILIVFIFIFSAVSVSLVSASFSSIIENIGKFISGEKDSQTYSVSNYQSEKVYSDISSGNLKLYDDYGSSAVISLVFEVNGKTISFSKIPGNKIEILPYLEGGEFIHKFDVPTDSLAKLPILDFKARYNIDCNQKLVYSDKIAYCGKIKIDFSTLENEYSNAETSCDDLGAVSVEECKILGYKIKPQSYDVSFVDGKIEAKLKDRYKTEVDKMKKLEINDVLALDPVYIIYNLTKTSVLNDVKCEGGGSYCHLAMNESIKLYLSFDVNVSSTTEYDLSNSNNVGLLMEGAYTNSTSVYGLGFNCNGSQYLTLGNGINVDPYANEFTFSIWFYSSDLNARAFHGIAGKYNPAQVISYGFYTYNNFMGFRAGNHSISQTILTPAVVNRWYNLLIVRNSTGWLNLYVNGTKLETPKRLTGSYTNYSLTYYPSNVFRLCSGGMDGGPGYMMKGGVDEVMFINRSLSSQEILQLYNQQFPRFKSSGTQMMNQSIDSGYNRVNVTSLLNNQRNSTSDNTAMSLNIHDGTSWTGSQTVVNGTKQNYTISNSATSLNLSYTYTPDAAKFFSPILITNITLETWNMATSGGGGNVSNVSFTSPTPVNGAEVDDANQIINVSIDGDMKELIWNWNGTNSTLFDSSLRLMYNFDNRSSLGENDSYPVNIVGGNAQITFNSAKYSASGKYGGSYEFNGTNYLELDGSSLDGFSDLSVELWVNRETNSDCVYYGCTFAGYPVGNSVFYPPVEGTYWIGEYDGQICLYIGENYQSTCVPSGWVQQNKWQHLVFVHDSDLDTDKIYVNGIEKVSKSGRTEDPDIGNYYYDIGGERLVGNIDEVKMWNRTLSSEEAKQEYYSNLYKYDSNKFVFSVKPVLDRGSYTYQASIKNSSNSLFSTELRDLTVVSKKIGYIYGADGLAAKVNKNTGKIYAYIKDLGGRLKAVVDTDTNEIVWKQEYYMSGEPATPQVEETFGQAGLKYDLVTGLLIGSNVMDPAGGGGIGADKPCDGSCCLDDCPESGSGSYYTT